MGNVFNVLIDFVVMSENEIAAIKTGLNKGPRMRDCIGQWEATVREAKEILANRSSYSQ